MKKFLLGIACGLVFALMAGFVMILAAARLGEQPPAVPSAGILILDLSGDLPEIAAPEIPLPMFESRAALTVHNVWDVLRKAAVDPRVKGIVLEPRALGTGWAKLEEVRVQLVKFRKSGKPVYAFLRNPGAREYYIATAADRIYMTGEDLLDLKGLRAELTYYKGLLDKIGVRIEIEHAGKFKDANDSYARTGPTPETVEVINSILDRIYGDLIGTIAEARKQPAEKVRETIDSGPFLGPASEKAGLVDGLRFADQVYEEIRIKTGLSETAKIRAREYAKVPAASVGLKGQVRIALLIGEGAIWRSGGGAFDDEEGIRSDTFIPLLEQVGKDDSVRAVILRVNSPGGDAIASDEILHAVKQLRGKKPMVISMSDSAASGGYYISMTGDPIVAYRNTFTGSIGVVFGKADLSGLNNKLGIQTHILQRGRNAAIDTSQRPLDDAGRAKLKDGIEQIYRSFLARVAEGRKRDVAEIEPLAEGRVWLGSQAKENRLVDEIGGLDEAIRLALEKAGAGGQAAELVVYPKRRSFLQQLFETRSVRALAEVWRPRLPVEHFEQVLGLGAGFRMSLRPWVPGGFLRMAPYELLIR